MSNSNFASSNPPLGSAAYASVPGERWRRFLERRGTQSNDFQLRLSRARFLYLHRRQASADWVAL
jgi:hypothetical protein